MSFLLAAPPVSFFSVPGIEHPALQGTEPRPSSPPFVSIYLPPVRICSPWPHFSRGPGAHGTSEFCCPTLSPSLSPFRLTQVLFPFFLSILFQSFFLLFPISYSSSHLKKLSLLTLIFYCVPYLLCFPCKRSLRLLDLYVFFAVPRCLHPPTKDSSYSSVCAGSLHSMRTVLSSIHLWMGIQTTSKN